MPEVEQDLEALAFKRTQVVDVKTHLLTRDRKTKNTITKRANVETRSRATDDRLHNDGRRGLRKPKFAATKGENKEEFGG